MDRQRLSSIAVRIDGGVRYGELAHSPDGHADGVDISPYALETAAAAAADRALDDRLTLHERDARTYVPDGDYDLVLSIGATHVFGGYTSTLEQAGRHVNRDGVLMIGEGFWQTPPTDAALAALDAKPTDFTDLLGLIAQAEDSGWTPIYAHVSDEFEWDDYEWSWTGSLTEWALDNPGHPDASTWTHSRGRRAWRGTTPSFSTRERVKPQVEETVSTDDADLSIRGSPSSAK
jgi:SAM-dependent methyltransferase